MSCRRGPDGRRPAPQTVRTTTSSHSLSLQTHAGCCCCCWPPGGAAVKIEPGYSWSSGRAGKKVPECSARPFLQNVVLCCAAPYWPDTLCGTNGGPGLGPAILRNVCYVTVAGSVCGCAMKSSRGLFCLPADGLLLVLGWLCKYTGLTRAAAGCISSSALPAQPSPVAGCGLGTVSPEMGTGPAAGGMRTLITGNGAMSPERGHMAQLSPAPPRHRGPSLIPLLCCLAGGRRHQARHQAAIA